MVALVSSRAVSFIVRRSGWFAVVYVGTTNKKSNSSCRFYREMLRIVRPSFCLWRWGMFFTQFELLRK